ncbi:MarR family winged helix-turn-helix transcriptional regulator [Variovorax sp.]|uniref:MarR family winged helix-turn-helix transcriptional regulator n=1 Tax=Variovorax sp. TaxID=1871043 RepID=UPI002D3A5C0A|nr:MarR family winged helix-turn-helix transcriptional regulator [Variovorax sp.]HYP83701.1 MarR family winged helix-turn-helix transcriptional regulator [Variovorax sp.]
MPASPPLAKHHFEVLAEFRYQMRRFERFSELAAQGEGITPQQYLLMLQVKGTPGRDWASVGELAERLQMTHHGAVTLVSRCEGLGLVVRHADAADRRKVQVHLTAQGGQLLQRLANLHRAELESLRGVFEVPQIDLPSP